MGASFGSSGTDQRLMKCGHEVTKPHGQQLATPRTHRRQFVLELTSRIATRLRARPGVSMAGLSSLAGMPGLGAKKGGGEHAAWPLLVSCLVHDSRRMVGGKHKHACVRVGRIHSNPQYTPPYSARLECTFQRQRLMTSTTTSR